jgi:hypothetical protein
MKFTIIMAAIVLSMASCGENSNTENNVSTDSTSRMGSDSTAMAPVDTLKTDTVKSGMDTMTNHQDSTKQKGKKKKAAKDTSSSNKL